MNIFQGTDMTVYMLILSTALAMAVGATPVVRHVALRLGVIDRPNARKIHVNPIPLMGGVAIYGAFIAALLLFGNRFRLNELIGILVGASLMSFLGLWDDRRGVSPFFKLVGQFLAASILVISGVRIGTFPWEAVNIAVTLGWVVVITNAMNLLDNMDGLSGGVGAVAAMFFLLLAAMNDQYLVGALSAALVGACFGFLVYNLNPASIVYACRKARQKKGWIDGTARYLQHGIDQAVRHSRTEVHLVSDRCAVHGRVRRGGLSAFYRGQ